jgi:hypothetical protein
MENIVGIKFIDKKRGEGAVITWGRLFHPVSDKILLEIVKKKLPYFGVHNLESIELSYSLMEISDQPYFHEQLTYFIKRPIKFDSKHPRWIKRKREALKNGREILFTGFKNEYLNDLERNKNGILS